MNLFQRNALRMAGLTEAIIRYPLSALLFFVSVVNIIYYIHDSFFSTNTDWSFEQSYYLSFIFIIGGLAGAAGQVLYERFFYDRPVFRWTIFGGIAVLTLLYYWIFLRPLDQLTATAAVQLNVLTAIFLTLFVWIPSIKTTFSFSTTFTTAFKGFFTSLLFSIVLTIGLMSILGTISLLLFPIDPEFFFDTVVIIYNLFFPLYFLAYVPKFDNKSMSEKDQSALTIPKLLEILVAYIVIPLIAVYTVILILYILPNIAGSFWTDNLLEPLLVSYSITGLLTLFLSENIQNRSTDLFKKVFPKVLLVIASFQTIASILKIGESGITHGRYYVILYGVFSIAASIIYSFFNKKELFVPAIFVVFSVISITPPIDAVTVGINAQENFVESVLRENDMLVNDEIVKSETISEEDREKIVNGVRYLYFNDGLDQAEWLPDNFSFYDDFERVFGFNDYNYAFTGDEDSFYGSSEESTYAEVRISSEASYSIPAEAADYYAALNISYGIHTDEPTETSVSMDDHQLRVLTDENTFTVSLLDNQEEVLLDHDLNFLREGRFENSYEVQMLEPEDLTFSEENDAAEMIVIVENIIVHDDNSLTADFKVLVSLKNE